MIELDDPISRINLGVEEFAVLRFLSVYTIRDLLLFDVDLLRMNGIDDPAVKKSIKVWKGLLRHEIDYGKLHAARGKKDVPSEPLRLHDPLEALPLKKDDCRTLESAGIVDIAGFLIADFAESGVPSEAAEQFESIRRDISREDALTVCRDKVNPDGLDELSMEVDSIEISAEAFLGEPISAMALDISDVMILASHGIATVDDFISFNFHQKTLRESLGVVLHHRFRQWQKYYRRCLGIPR